MLVSRLDSVAWLLNLRADDIACTPVAMAYCLVLPDSATLFINRSRLPQEAQYALAKEGCKLPPMRTLQTPSPRLTKW